jgi:hypothetical protein
MQTILNMTPTAVLAELLAVAHKDNAMVLEAHSRPGEGARGERHQALAAASFQVEDFRGHDLRRTAASLMAAAAFNIWKILNRVEQGVTKVYDRHSYDQRNAPRSNNGVRS